MPLGLQRGAPRAFALESTRSRTRGRMDRLPRDWATRPNLKAALHIFSGNGVIYPKDVTRCERLVEAVTPTRPHQHTDARRHTRRKAPNPCLAPSTMPNDGSCLLLAAAVACEDAPASPHTSSLALVLVVAFELSEDLSLEILVRAGWTVLRVLRMARATSEDGVFVLGTYVRSFGRSSRGVSGFASLRRRKGAARVGGFVSIGANDPSSPPTPKARSSRTHHRCHCVIVDPHDEARERTPDEPVGHELPAHARGRRRVREFGSLLSLRIHHASFPARRA